MTNKYCQQHDINITNEFKYRKITQALSGFAIISGQSHSYTFYAGDSLIIKGVIMILIFYF